MGMHGRVKDMKIGSKILSNRGWLGIVMGKIFVEKGGWVKEKKYIQVYKYLNPLVG